METNEKVILGIVSVVIVGGLYVYMKKKTPVKKVEPQNFPQGNLSAPMTVFPNASATPLSAQAITTNTPAPTTALTTAPGYGSEVYNWLMQHQPTDANVWNIASVADLTTIYNYDYAVNNNTPIAQLLPLYAAALNVANNYGISDLRNSNLDNVIIISKATYSSPAGNITSASPINSSTFAEMGVWKTPQAAKSVDVTQAVQQLANYVPSVNISLSGGQQISMFTDIAPGILKTLNITYTVGLGGFQTKSFSQNASTSSIQIALP